MISVNDIGIVVNGLCTVLIRLDRSLRALLTWQAILGKGMFGTVWRAMDSRSGHWYAVKKSHTYRQATVTREREVTNHVLMNPHPFIVQIFGNHFIESGTGFSSLVMEFCAGGDLQDKVNAGAALRALL